MTTLPDLPPGYELRLEEVVGLVLVIPGENVSVVQNGADAVSKAWQHYGRRLHRAGVVEALRGCAELLDQKYHMTVAEVRKGLVRGDVAETYSAARRALRIVEGDEK